MGILDKFSQLGGAYAQLKDNGADPFAVKFDRVLSPTSAMRGSRPITLFGTNNYLGLTFDEACIDAAKDGLASSGTGTTGSRIASGSYDAHTQLERALAAFYGRRHCMVFTTGYQANLGMISTLVGKDDYLIIDADSHASIYDGAKLAAGQVIRFRHNDAADLRKRLRRLPATGNKLIVVEGIYSMLGDLAPLREIAAVKRETGAYLMIDEAHSLGVLGDRGRGLAEEAGVEDAVDFVVGTFSKTLGSIGGFCVSDLEGFDILRVACRPYMFTASLPPSLVASTLRAIARVEESPELRHRLRTNARRFYDGLASLGFALGPVPTPIVSVILGDRDLAVGFWNQLLESGLYVNLALPPATPDGAALLRCSVSASHTPQQIDAAIDLFGEIGTEFGAIAPLPRRQHG